MASLDIQGSWQPAGAKAKSPCLERGASQPTLLWLLRPRKPVGRRLGTWDPKVGAKGLSAYLAGGASSGQETAATAGSFLGPHRVLGFFWTPE
jgi:hypothetical protein